MKDIITKINESKTYTNHSLVDMWRKYVHDGSPSDEFLKDFIIFGASKDSNYASHDGEEETIKICQEIVKKLNW